MKTISLEIPIYLNGKALNLNRYRNMHHFSLGKEKKEYTNLIINDIPNISLNPPIKIEYLITLKNKKSDLMNFGSIVDKYFQDALVKKGVIADDFGYNVPLIIFELQGYDNKNPKCQVKISERDAIV